MSAEELEAVEPPPNQEEVPESDPPVVADAEEEAKAKAKAEAVLKEARAAKLRGINVISEFEQRRRGYFGPQIASNQSHWHAFLQTFNRSKVENERIFEFIHRRLEVEAKYADALAQLPTADLGKGQGGWRKADKKPKAKCAVPSMEELVTSTEDTAAKVQHFLTTVRRDIVDDKLKALVSAYKEASDEVVGEGTASLDNVVKADRAVQAAFDDYSLVVDALLSPEEGSSEGNADLWLTDMQYRLAVQCQKDIWQDSQQKLGELFTRMKTLELNRRQTLHSLVLKLVQSQGELWAQLPHIATGTSLRISELKTDPHEVETELSDEIRAGARAMKEQQLQARKSPPASPSDDARDVVTPPPPSADPFTDALASPLEVALVKRVELVERRVTVGVESLPLMVKWKPALAVLTLDHWLHVFDLPPSLPADMGVQGAFKAIAPKPVDAKGRFKKGHPERVSPLASLALSFCKARHRAEDGEQAFEVVQSIPNSGFVKAFKSHEVRRVVLRAGSQEQMVDWVVVVNGEAQA